MNPRWVGLIGKISKGEGWGPITEEESEANHCLDVLAICLWILIRDIRVAQNIRGEFLAELLLPGVGTPPEPRAEHNGQPGGEQPKSNIRRNCGSS